LTELLEPFTCPAIAQLERDDRFTGKIRWHVRPVALGGEPDSDKNLTWVSPRQHAKLVAFWNSKYQELQR
jgi:hypothetical protein